ncbi:CRISPR-associated protein [Porphyromonas cangingivalis]|uniref:pre-crRNA processing endonuclease n=1 Tax=Porphyromonas cangingivalis TaxID=36874 RepID=A0A0A2EYX9_PORCN|nr:type I-C CRISPR-associated protein Cas5c [Porphyromonas cangingivalis]KGN82745.1 CRISPR-associated protein [Porphyromonas cangingivalis]
MQRKTYCLEIRGDYACFTRPELKVERVSYDVITPSAARNIFQAIFWKEAIKWHIKRIEVLNPIKRCSVRRNEVSEKMSVKSRPIIIDSPKNRQQRTAYILRDVAYRIFAEMEFIPLEQRSQKQREQVEYPEAETPRKYQEMFERRASQGQCFTQPYLGCREFSCSFELITDTSESKGIDESRDLGIILYDMDFTSKPSPSPLFFHAQMEQGVIIVPSIDSREILR